MPQSYKYVKNFTWYVGPIMPQFGPMVSVVLFFAKRVW